MSVYEPERLPRVRRRTPEERLLTGAINFMLVAAVIVLAWGIVTGCMDGLPH